MLNKISKSLNKYSNYEEMKRNSPAFAQGVKDFREGKVKLHSINYNWIKKWVSNKDWNTHYIKNNYCFLKSENKGVWVGFLKEGNGLPENCEICNEEEMRQIDLHRRACNIYPNPFKLLETKLTTKLI